MSIPNCQPLSSGCPRIHLSRISCYPPDEKEPARAYRSCWNGDLAMNLDKKDVCLPGFACCGSLDWSLISTYVWKIASRVTHLWDCKWKTERMNSLDRPIELCWWSWESESTFAGAFVDFAIHAYTRCPYIFVVGATLLLDSVLMYMRWRRRYIPYIRLVILAVDIILINGLQGCEFRPSGTSRPSLHGWFCG